MSSWQSVYDDLVTARYPSLLAYASALTGQRSTAEDLVHDALIRTFGRPRRLHSADHAERYVRRTIVTLFIDRGRRRGTFLAAAPVIAAPASRPDGTAAVDDADMVAQALATLAPRVRAVLVLRFYDDLTVPHIAEQLGLAVGTVKRYLSDGLAALEPQLHIQDLEGVDDTFRIPVTAARKATS